MNSVASNLTAVMLACAIMIGIHPDEVSAQPQARPGHHPPAHAEGHTSPTQAEGHPSPIPALPGGDAAMSEGVVRKVDRDTGRLTLRHGPIANLDMPQMSMVFRVSDPAMLDGLQPDAKVRFKADRIEGQLTVTHIEPAG
jgi:Cu/Ag efflux protein CusF